MGCRAFDYRTGDHRFRLRPAPVLDIVQNYNGQVDRLVERFNNLRRRTDQLTTAITELRRRKSKITSDSPYHRKLVNRVERMVVTHEAAQQMADIIAVLKPGQVKVKWVKSQAILLEFSMLPPVAGGRKLNHGGVIAAVPCDGKLYSVADGVSGRLTAAKYAGLSEELLPADAKWPKLLMEMATLVQANGGIVAELKAVH